MEPSNKIEKYCEDVCSQIRWKKIRPQISTEIQNHIEDQRDAYISDGDDESLATEKAILQMGDAIEIGEELDRTHKPEKQWFMIGLVGIFMAIGLISKILLYTFVFEQPENTGMFIIQYVVAFGILIACYNIDFSVLGKLPFAIYIGSLIISCVFFLFVVEINGVTNLDLGPFYSLSIRPMYMIYTLSFALIVYRMRNQGYVGILICGFLYLPFAIILASTYLAGLLMYTMISFIVLCYAIYKDWFKVNKKIAFSIVLVPTFIVTSLMIINYLLNRNFSWYNIKFLFNIGGSAGTYILNMISELLNGAVFIGKGTIPDYIINDRFFNDGFIPFNYPLTYAIYRFGYISLVIVVALISTFYVFAIKKALREKSMLGSLIIIVVSSIFILQSICFILANLGYGYGETLPFIFSDGLSLFITSMLVGFMLSVFKTGEAFSDNLKYGGKRIDIKIQMREM